LFDDSAAAVFLPPPGRHAQLDLDPFTGSGPFFFATPHPNFHPNPKPPPPKSPPQITPKHNNERKYVITRVGFAFRPPGQNAPGDP
jgi:hypothetical protein